MKLATYCSFISVVEVIFLGDNEVAIVEDTPFAILCVVGEFDHGDPNEDGDNTAPDVDNDGDGDDDDDDDDNNDGDADADGDDDNDDDDDDDDDDDNVCPSSLSFCRKIVYSHSLKETFLGSADVFFLGLNFRNTTFVLLKNFSTLEFDWFQLHHSSCGNKSMFIGAIVNAM
jgi:hypothetical protein